MALRLFRGDLRPLVRSVTGGDPGWRIAWERLPGNFDEHGTATLEAIVEHPCAPRPEIRWRAGSDKELEPFLRRAVKRLRGFLC